MSLWSEALKHLNKVWLMEVDLLFEKAEILYQLASTGTTDVLQFFSCGGVRFGRLDTSCL